MNTHERKERLKRLAESETAHNFLALDDETKRGIFADYIDESERRKRIESERDQILAALREARECVARNQSTFVSMDTGRRAIECDQCLATIDAAIAATGDANE